MWLRIAKLGDLPADITPHVLRHSFASLAADLGYNEPTIASLLGHKTHSITSRYVHSADAVLLAAADAVANATMKLMALGSSATPVAGSAARWISRVGRIHLFIGVFVTHGLAGVRHLQPHLPSVVWDEFTSYRCFRPTGFADVLWRRAISAETRSHCRPERGIAPFRRGNVHRSSAVLRSVAVSAKCIAIANSGFSGGAVRSTTGGFGDGSSDVRATSDTLAVSTFSNLAVSLTPFAAIRYRSADLS